MLCPCEGVVVLIDFSSDDRVMASPSSMRKDVRVLYCTYELRMKKLSPGFVHGTVLVFKRRLSLRNDAGVT